MGLSIVDVRILNEDRSVNDDHADLFAAWYAVGRAVGEYEFGDRSTIYSVEEIIGRAREQTTARVERLAALDDDGRVVGATWSSLPLTDNPHLAFAELEVHPEHRRRGVGSALLAEVEARAVAAGRSTLVVEGYRSDERPDVMSPFARSQGYEPALVNLRSDLDLPDGAPDVERALAAVAGPTGTSRTGTSRTGETDSDRYRLVTWWDGVPDEWVEERARLHGRMTTDAPMGDLDLEPEAWDADRVREVFRIAAAQDRRVVETVAVDGDTGRLAGFTTMAVASHSPRNAYQWDTLVLREHRGHGLGLRMKAGNLRALLAELPGVRRVTTWNAEQNEPMLRVNRAMGFAVVGRITEWQKALLPNTPP